MSTPEWPQAAIDAFRRRLPDFTPRVGIVLGSGLGPLGERVQAVDIIDYADLPGFPETGVEGHKGRLICGLLGGVPVACLQGRVHAYEGRGLDIMKVPVRLLKGVGCEALYLTCAAGSLDLSVDAGRLLAISDHINVMGGNPLSGPNDETIGPRFTPMEDAYDPALLALQHRAAREVGIDLAEGIYAAWLGPTFETKAEVRMIKAFGANAVGMSTAPECILARHCGLKVTATAVITNLGVGLGTTPVTHAQTLEYANRAGADLQRLVTRFLELLGSGQPEE